MFLAISEYDGIPVLTIRPDSISVLRDDEALRIFQRYWKVIKGESPARFLIAKSVAVEYSEDDSEATLWRIHDSAMKEFWEIFGDDKEEASVLERLREGRFPQKNLLSLKLLLARKMLKRCRFCEWRCGVDRTSGKKGVCGLDDRSYIASVFIHMGEEAELVPSYTIFFSHCNFKCVFCQNWDISQQHSGEVLPAPRIARAIEGEWRARTIRNVNWVGGEPTPNIHYILEVLSILNASVPQIWNSNFYNSVEAMKLLIGVIDVWLPDFKYGNNECALRLSKIPKYFDTVTRNFQMIDNGEEEILIRHLVLPNHIECCTKPVLEWIAKNLRRSRVRVNVMEQYRPEYKAYKYPDISRRLKRSEWLEAINYARSLGLSLTL